MHARTAESLLAPRSGVTPRFWGLSIALHLGIGGGLMLWQALAAHAPIDLDQKPIKATLVRLGKPREEKLLPRKEEPPPPPPPAPVAEPVPTAAPPVPTVPSPIAKPAPTAAPSPTKTRAANADARNRLFGAFDKASRSAKPEELEGAADGDLDGDAAKAEGERYWGLLKVQVHRQYDVSQTLSEGERISLRAQVHLRIDKNGSVLRAQLARPSGNAIFDAAVLAAIERASPFPPPPDVLREAVRDDGVILEFRP